MWRVKGWSVENLKQAKTDCPSSGCNIVLEAITEVLGPDAVKDESRLLPVRCR
jgi:hypothetical protein